ncbi:MAG TPA: AMP-binding protein [Terricaulis sp.]|nr:AMP-binding protein [Terricaulis sp.]
MGVDLVDISAKRAALTPHRVALIDALSGRAHTYAQLNDRAERAAAVLAARGVGYGDRIGVLCRNRIEFFELMFAAAKLGAILAPLSWRAPAPELAPLLADCAPKLVIHGREDEAVAAALAIPLLALDGDYEALLARAAPLELGRRWRGEDVWTLIYTSGTTGEPKAVIKTLQMAVINAFHATQAFGIREADHTLNFLPMFHTAGIHLLAMPVLMAGGTVHVLPSFDADDVMALLPKLDLFFAVPAVYQQLAHHAGFDAADLAHVRAWGCGGAPLPDVLAERFAAKGALVCNGYGMTETGPTSFVAAREDALSKIGSVGKPQLLLDVRIVDGQGRDVAEGESGEIWMRGPGVTPGYWNKPGETAKAFTEDGWLKSGDIGRRDADGCYYVAGRIKEMFISGGSNVYPAEIENVLARHPAVLEAAIVGVADEKWGEAGHAFVMLKPEAASIAEIDLIQFCRANLAGYKVPRSISFVAEFPRTAAGKIKKHLLTPAAPAPVR